MLMQPPLEIARRAMRSVPAQRAANVTDQQEGADFMAFLGEHQQFAATHRGA